MDPYEMCFSQCIDLIDSPTLWTFHWIRIPQWQHVEDGEVKLEREEENEAPNVLPEFHKKKRRTKKAEITSMERIDSCMSNTYLGKMRAAGQIQKAPISRTFFEKNKRKKKKKKKVAKTRAKNDSNLTQLKFLIGKKK